MPCGIIEATPADAFLRSVRRLARIAFLTASRHWWHSCYRKYVS
jgi:hypothetical protein